MRSRETTTRRPSREPSFSVASFMQCSLYHIRPQVPQAVSAIVKAPAQLLRVAAVHPPRRRRVVGRNEWCSPAVRASGRSVCRPPAAVACQQCSFAARALLVRAPVGRLFGQLASCRGCRHQQLGERRETRCRRKARYSPLWLVSFEPQRETIGDRRMIEA